MDDMIQFDSSFRKKKSWFNHDLPAPFSTACRINFKTLSGMTVREIFKRIDEAEVEGGQAGQVTLRREGCEPGDEKKNMRITDKP